MAGKRFALIIATSEYVDPTLKLLNAPAQDAKGLSEVLSNKVIGNYEVKILLNESSYKIRQEIEEFFGIERNRDDLLLLYFSCHGIKGTDAQLYFATNDTKSKRLYSTAVRARDVNDLMSACPAWKQILILDCCYSGAFARGMTVRADKQIHTNEHFEEGKGRLVMTASDSMQYSFEPEVEGNVKQEQDNVVRSFFTDALVQGLRTGEADRDGNGHITYDELYDYIRDHVRQNSPKQTPRKWGFDVQGDIIVANSTKTTSERLLTEQKGKEEQQQPSKLLLEKIIDEDEWNELLKAIEGKRCTPFIGPGASSQWIPLNDIARKWAEQYGYPLEDPDDISKVSQYLAIVNYNRGGELFPKKKLRAELRTINPPDFSLPEFRNTSHAVLADLNIPLYITTNYDQFLEEALRSRGKNPVSEFCRWSKELKNFVEAAGISSIFDKRSSKISPTPDRPIVYHLYGDINTPQSMVLTQLDHNDLVINLNREELLPPIIRRALSTNTLLFIGYDTEDEIFRRRDLFNVSYHRMSIAVLVPSLGIEADIQRRYMEAYLRKSLKAEVYWGDASEFAAELRKRLYTR